MIKLESHCVNTQLQEACLLFSLHKTEQNTQNRLHVLCGLPPGVLTESALRGAFGSGHPTNWWERAFVHSWAWRSFVLSMCIIYKHKTCFTIQVWVNKVRNLYIEAVSSSEHLQACGLGFSLPTYWFPVVVFTLSCFFCSLVALPGSVHSAGTKGDFAPFYHLWGIREVAFVDCRFPGPDRDSCGEQGAGWGSSACRDYAVTQSQWRWAGVGHRGRSARPWQSLTTRKAIGS